MNNLKIYQRLIIVGIICLISIVPSIVLKSNLWITATIGCFVYEMIDHLVYYLRTR